MDFDIHEINADEYFQNITPEEFFGSQSVDFDMPEQESFNSTTENSGDCSAKQSTQIFKVIKTDDKSETSRERYFKSRTSTRELEDSLEELNRRIKCSMTSENKRELKKQIRMLKNRVYAQNSRDRKKDIFEYLEQRNEDLVQENSSLQTLLQEKDAYIKELESKLSLVCDSCEKKTKLLTVDNLSTYNFGSSSIMSRASVLVGLLAVLLVVGTMFRGGSQSDENRRNLTEINDLKVATETSVDLYREGDFELLGKKRAMFSERLASELTEKSVEMGMLRGNETLDLCLDSRGVKLIQENKGTSIMPVFSKRIERKVKPFVSAVSVSRMTAKEKMKVSTLIKSVEKNPLHSN